ncbi:MAG: hypothetical protein LBJ18_00655 [Rickettsiales bacterium]|jgi:hypothetical protein|nr:hypothetical protein [Rickettsiales bacterium]
MPKVAILYIALNRYSIFWKDFYLSCEKYLENADKEYFIWTNNGPEEFIGADTGRVHIFPATPRGWPYDSELRFEMFSAKADILSKFDYIYFFNANMQFINPTDLSEIAPHDWNDGLVAGIHPGVLRDSNPNPDRFFYERRPESTAFIPYGSGRYYVCGAFNGGTADAFLEMCKTLARNVQTDWDNGINAIVDDESHLNAYMYKRNFLLAGVGYGFPEQELKRLARRYRQMVKVISRAKDSPKYGGTRWLRGTTNRKMVYIPGLKTAGRIASGLFWSVKIRKKIRGFCGG